MAERQVLTRAELAAGAKKTVEMDGAKILLVHTAEGELHALEGECPHAKGPLEEGAICNGRLVCPWHMGTFELKTGAWVEPPPLRGLKVYRARWEGDAVMLDPEPVVTPTLAGRTREKNAAGGVGNGAGTYGAGTYGAEETVVTIGGGAAAAAAVCTLRQGGFAGTITMVDPVAGEPVDRTNLSKMALSKQKPAEPLFDGESAAALGVTRVHGAVERLEAPTVERTRGRVVTDRGEQIAFDYALLATGGAPDRLKIAGEDHAHVYTIRHVSDLDAIDARIGGRPPESVRAVILGDSFIAFEAASALKARGLQVTVVARDGLPFANRFGEDVAKAIVGLHRQNGVELRLGADANGVTDEVVTLRGGEALPAEIVIMAIGVTPATKFQHGLRVEKDCSVAVGATLRAGERVWVAGDIAKVDGVRIEHWRLAEQHGRVAGLAMLRAMGADVDQPEASYHGVPFFWTYYFGKRFGYIGHADAWDDVIVDGDLGITRFLAHYIHNGAVKAVMGCGQESALAMLAERMRDPMTLEEARQAVVGLI